MALNRKTQLGPGEKSLQRGSTFAKPRGRLQSKSRPAAPGDPTAGELRRQALAFERAVKAAGRCAACGRRARSRRAELDAHHVVPKEILKRVERERRLAPGTLVWDPANGIALCSEQTEERCHARHTLAVRRVPRSRLPNRALRFAAKLGLSHVIERHYPDDLRPQARS
jgi:hypothetical protein